MRNLRNPILICIAIALTSGSAYAGSKEQARIYVESTKEGARSLARALFHQYLRSAALEVTNASHGATSIVQNTNELKKSLDRLTDLRLKLAMAAEKATPIIEGDAVDVLFNELRGIYQETGKIYVATREMEKQRDQITLENGSAAAQLRRTIDAFLENIQTTCRNGIAANFEYPALPPIKPVVPSVSVGVQVIFPENGSTIIQPDAPSVQTEKINGANAAALYGLTTAGGYVLGAYLVTGKVVLTQAAASTLTSSQAMGAMGVGLGVTAAVALVVYIDGLLEAIEQSKEVSDALWIVHNDKADAETVRAEFTSICKPFASTASQLPNRLDLILKGDPIALAALETDRKKVAALTAESLALQDKVNQEYSRILKVISEEPEAAKMTAEDRHKRATEILETSEPYRQLKEFTANTTSEMLTKVFEVGFLELLLSSERIEKAMAEQYKALFKNQTEFHLDKVIRLAQMARRMAIPAKVTELVREEVAANVAIGKLFREFDLAFADYVQKELTFSYDEGFLRKLRTWMANVSAARSASPESPTLKVLQSRGTSLLTLLQDRPK